VEDLSNVPLSQFAGYSVLRVWSAFSVSSFLVAALFCIWDGANPLRSDDPYCVGLIAGASTAIVSLCWVVANWWGWPGWRRHGAYFVPLVLMVLCLALIDVLSSPEAEGQGLPTLFAAAIAVGGVAAYPVHLLNGGTKWLIVVSGLGVLLLLGCFRALTIVNW